MNIKTEFVSHKRGSQKLNLLSYSVYSDQIKVENAGSGSLVIHCSHSPSSRMVLSDLSDIEANVRIFFR